MSDDDNGDAESNQAVVYMRTSSAHGFDGNEVEVRVEGSEGETVDDIEDTAQERFRQAVESSTAGQTERREYQ